MKRAMEIAGGEENIIMYTCAHESAVPFCEKLGMRRAGDVMVYNRADWTAFAVN